MYALGKQLLLELKECDPGILDDQERLRATLIEAAREVGATVVGDSFHRFEPYGITGIIAIAESHLCIHTWPEYGYAAVDVFTCGDAFQPEKAADIIISRLQAREVSVIELKRGILPEENKRG